MLNENIRAIRRSKGLSQEELAGRLHVVRQTISKWEQGTSVPDSDLLIALSEALDTPVSTLLGETVQERAPDGLTALSQQLEQINRMFARRRARQRAALHVLSLALCAAVAALSAALILLHSPYLGWDYRAPETAVMGVAFHAFKWLFVRSAPAVFAFGAIGAFLTRRRP